MSEPLAWTTDYPSVSGWYWTRRANNPYWPSAIQYLVAGRTPIDGYEYAGPIPLPAESPESARARLQREWQAP